MFIDPSMGGQVYNPWRVQSPILQRFGEMNPARTTQQMEQQESNKTNYRFFGANPRDPAPQSMKVFRSFF